MEILAVGSVADVAKKLVASLFALGFGAFLIAVLVDQIRTRVWRRLGFLAAGGWARARFVGGVKVNTSTKKPKYRLTVDFTTRYGLTLTGVVLAQPTGHLPGRGDRVHVLYPPLRPGAAVEADWLGMFGRLVVLPPILIGSGGYFMLVGAVGLVDSFR